MNSPTITAAHPIFPLLTKSSYLRPSMFKSGSGSVSIRAGTVVKVWESLVHFEGDTAVTMPTLEAGTDYAVFVSDSGSVEAVAWTENTGESPVPPSGAWELIGGFHYLPGGVPSIGAQTGGNTTPAILSNSIWDLRFRPNCPDPRGMTYTGSCWIDIYFLNPNHETIGTSRENQIIANGRSGGPDYRPVRPTRYGGNGSAKQAFNWWAAVEALQIHGKRLPRYDEMVTAAYGVTEAASRGSLPVKTGLSRDNVGSSNRDEKFTSWCGLIQATGCHWIWLGDFNYWPDSTGGEAWRDIAEGRGRIYIPGNRALAVMLFGGKYNWTVESGSRTTETIEIPSDVSQSISQRGAADHMQM